MPRSRSQSPKRSPSRSSQKEEELPYIAECVFLSFKKALEKVEDVPLWETMSRELDIVADKYEQRLFADINEVQDVLEKTALTLIVFYLCRYARYPQISVETSPFLKIVSEYGSFWVIGFTFQNDFCTYDTFKTTEITLSHARQFLAALSGAVDSYMFMKTVIGMTKHDDELRSLSINTSEEKLFDTAIRWFSETEHSKTHTVEILDRVPISDEMDTNKEFDWLKIGLKITRVKK